MIKELGLVVTGFAIGVGVTLYYTKDYIVEGFAHKLSDVMEEEIQDMKDELYNEQVEKDNRRDYTKPLRKSGKYPWGEHKSYHEDQKEPETFALPMLMSSREDAVKVLNTLWEMLDSYHVVSIADYYDLVDVNTTYKDNLYGWVDGELADARVIPLDGEFSIKLPVAKRLNK